MTADGEVEHLPYDCGLTRPVIELLGDMQAEFLDVSCSSNVLLGADPLLMSFWECTFGSVLLDVPCAAHVGRSGLYLGATAC